MNLFSRTIECKTGIWKQVIAVSAALFISGCHITELASPSPVQQYAKLETTVSAIDKFGDAILDISDLNLEYGDSVNVEFSGGYTGKAVPVYPEFYGNQGDCVVTDYYKDYIAVAGIGYSFADEAGIEVGETVVITLDEPAKYRELFEAYHIDPNWEQRPDQTVEEYLNVRSPAAGTMGKGILYRGASPFSELFQRIDEMEEYLRQQGVRTIISLSEGSEEELRKRDFPEYSNQLVQDGNVIVIPIGIDFRDPEVMKQIGIGLNRMSEKESPYLIQCSYGRDRTGVICALLEALCEASAQEIIDDYMISYKNLHEVPMDSESLQYQLYYTRMLESLSQVGFPREGLENADLEQIARTYLSECGMSEAEMDRLRAVLEGKQSDQ